jgi:hypothetical protein
VTTKQPGKSIDEDINSLFKLPLAEFIGARKTLRQPSEKRRTG